MLIGRKYPVITVLSLLLLISIIVPQSALAAKVISIDSCLYSSVALCDDGSVFAWGWNNGGFISYKPVNINITDVKSVSISNGNIYFLKSDGTVWATGNNVYGQLGIGTDTDVTGIVKVVGLEKVTAISAGTDHVLAIKDDGTVWAWGDNLQGEIGIGNTSHSQTCPVQVDDLSNINTIYAGYHISAALSEDGTLWVWGENEDGHLGDGTDVLKSSPIRLDISNVKAIHPGESNSVLALKNDGTVWSWGNDMHNQLGYNVKQKVQFLPRQIDGLSDVIEVDASVINSLALKKDGTVWIWGGNQNGIFGNGQQYGPDTTSPVMVSSLSNVKDIALGWSHAIALSEDGTVWAWGDNSMGQIGNGENSGMIVKPIAIIKGYTNITQTDSGDSIPISTIPNSNYATRSDNNFMGIIGIAGVILVIIAVIIVIKIRKM